MEIYNLAWGICLYAFYSGGSVPTYILSSLQHKGIPKSELERFRKEWMERHQELERKLNHEGN